METHCTEHTDLKMNFKRLSNEANAKQLTLDKPPWQRAIGREDGGFLGQRRSGRAGLDSPLGFPMTHFYPELPVPCPLLFTLVASQTSQTILQFEV